MGKGGLLTEKHLPSSCCQLYLMAAGQNPFSPQASVPTIGPCGWPGSLRDPQAQDSLPSPSTILVWEETFNCLCGPVLPTHWCCSCPPGVRGHPYSAEPFVGWFSPEPPLPARPKWERSHSIYPCPLNPVSQAARSKPGYLAQRGVVSSRLCRDH